MVTRFLRLPLLVTSLSFMILIFPSPITSFLSLVHDLRRIFALFFTLIRLAPSAHLLFTPDLTTAIRCILLSSLYAVKSPSAYPECSYLCCCCSSPVFQYWPYSQIAAVAQGTGMHWIQSYLHHVRISSPSLLLHVTCAISWSASQSSLLRSIIRIGHSSPGVSWLQSQDHKPLLPVCRTHLWNKLRAFYHLNPSSSPSSSPSSYSDFGLLS